MDRKGFTLVEVMVAMVVLSIALLAVIKMNIMYVKANTYNHQLSAATMYAQEKMEELRGYARSDRSDKFSPFDFDFLLDESDEFTTVIDTDDTGTETVVTIPGLSSGNAVVELDNGTVYSIMAPVGGSISGGPIFGSADFKNAIVTADATVTTFRVDRTWSVEPLNVFDETKPDYAHLIVEATWVDQYAEPRTVRVESIVHRRQ